MNKELLQILGSPWLIDESAVIGAMPLIAKFFSGQADIKDLVKSEDKPVISYAVQMASGGVVNSFNSLSEAPEGSISVLKIKNALVKPDYYGPGMATLGKYHKEADNHPNIIGHVLYIDSPGGTVDGTEEFAAIIKASTKPVVAFVDGLMASAAYWIGSSAKEIILNGKTARVGSVGTMLGMADFNGIFEKYGAKFHNVRASDSSEKNESFYQMVKGNYDPIREELLNPLNDVFLAEVKENRGSKIQKTALKGKTFIGQAAIDEGLADSIGDFDSAIKRATELANQQKVNNQIKSTMKLKKNLTAIAAFFGFSASVDEQDLPVLAESHMEKLDAELTSLKNANTALSSEKEALVAEKATLTTSLTEATDKATQLAADLATAKSTITDLESKVKEYGSQPGAMGTKAIKTKEEIEEGKATSFFDPEAEHNKIEIN